MSRPTGWSTRVQVITLAVKSEVLRRICLDAETEQPAWVSVNIGASGILETLVPLEGTSMVNNTLNVAYDCDTILDAPWVEDGDNLWPEEQNALDGYYRPLRSSPPQSTTKLPSLPASIPEAGLSLAPCASGWRETSVR